MTLVEKIAKNRSRLLTEAEAELAWHFSPNNRDSYHASWALQAHIKIDDRLRVLLEAQDAKTKTAILADPSICEIDTEAELPSFIYDKTGHRRTAGEMVEAMLDDGWVKPKGKK